VKRDRNLHPLSWDHHSALTAIVMVRRQLVSPRPDAPITTLAREFVQFHRDALIPHFRREEEWLLPRLLVHLSPEDIMVARTLRDHIVIHRIVLELDRAVRKDRGVQPLLSELVDRLEEHIRFEERELFVRAEACLPEDELDSLGGLLHGAEQPAVVIPGSDGRPVRPGPPGDLAEA